MQEFAARPVEARYFACGLADARDDVIAHHRLEEVFLVLEVEVERPLGDAGARGDVVEPGARIALFDEEFERGGDQFGRPCFLAAFPAGLGNGG